MTSLSVVLPIFNAENYLHLALDSIFSQSFTDFEVIAVDDGSSDTSLNILEKYATQDSRLKIISRENRGLIYSLNEACVAAKSAYLLRMDADDICADDRFERQYRYMENNPDCVALGGRVLLIDDSGDPIKEMGEFESHQEIDSLHMRGEGGAIIHPAAIIRKSAWEQAGKYRSDFPHAEDLDLFLRLAETGRLANLKHQVLSYRQHMESVGYTKRQEQFLSARKAVLDAVKRRGLNTDLVDSLKEKKSATKPEVYQKWAWWALGAGHTKTARKYAVKTLTETPIALSAWKLFACTIRDSLLKP